jgi:CubicO group peptidase (beta-lactamase class C family)|tara:strand:+ start:13723 stop:15723 length:2001 start_codon:yes stop_codon:yes gene_type:complete
MKSLLVLLSLILLLLTPFSTIHSQIQKGELIKGKILSSEIAPAEKHHYQITLEKDQFAFFTLMQKGVDVKITTYDPKGKKLEEFDTPNGQNGPEKFSIISSKKGIYVIEVSALDEKQPVGVYDLKLEILKKKAVLPNEQVDELFAAWDSKETPGAAVAVVQNGKIIYKKGYGMANLEYDIPITTSSIFHIASISKQFTVFSILLLEKQGKLSLNDDIRKYLPEVPDFGKTITLKHLASHTSGLRDQWEILALTGGQESDLITTEHILKLVGNQKELNFNPGDDFMYCNTGFTLLAEVVARISNMSFAEFTQKNIFEPLKMSTSLFFDDNERIVKNRAYSYHTYGEGFKKSVLNYANVGATSLFTTVEDLSLWSLNFSSLKIGDTSIFNQMKKPIVLNDSSVLDIGLGQFLGNYKGLNEIQHGGADAGYRTFLTRFPDQNFSVIVFSNLAEFNTRNLAHKIVDIYLKDKLVDEEKSKAKAESAETISIAAKTLNTYLGDYELRPGFIISIIEGGGKLYAQVKGQTTISLVAVSDTKFELKEIGAKVEFIPNGGEKVELFKLNQGGEITDVSRVKPFDISTINLSDYIGDYYSEELMTTYSISATDSNLLVKHIRVSDFTINPYEVDLFTDNSWFFSQVQFFRNSENKVTGFKVSNGRARNNHFTKVD